MKVERAGAARFLVGCIAGGLAACGGSGGDATDRSPAGECAEGFAPDPRGFCIEIVTADDCAPGSRAKIGTTRCAPVGWTTPCPTGTKRDPTGWGCVDLRPAACAPRERESATSGTCVPVGDCSAAFPPPGAVVVDASLSDGAVDATHVRTIGEGVAAAAAGGTVAIAPGTYAEDVKIERALTLAGRCPSQVTIVPASSTEAGILVAGAAKGVVVRGLSVKGHVGGIAVYGEASATIEEVVVDSALSFGIIADGSTVAVKRSKVTGTLLGPGNKGAWGIAASGSSVTIDEVDIVGGTDAVFAESNDTSVTVSRVAASGQAPASSSRSSAIYARGAKVTVDGSILHDIVADGAIVAELIGASVEVRGSVIRDVAAGDRARGDGAVAFEGGRIAIRSSSVAGAESIGLLSRGLGSVLDANDTVVRGPEKSSARPDANLVVTGDGAGIGAEVLDGATMKLDGVAIVRPWGWGAYAGSGATLALSRALIDAPRALFPTRSPGLPFAVGVAANDASATIDDVTVVRATLAAVTAGKGGALSGRGLYVREVAATEPIGTGAGAAAGEGATIDLDASAIADATTSGLFASRGSGTSVRLSRSTIHGTRASEEGFGHGAIAIDGAEVVLDRTAIFDNAAIGFAADGGRARLLASVVAKNAIALHLQGGSSLTDSADAAELGPTEIRVSPDTKFFDNSTKLGGGILPFPVAVLP